MNKRSVRVGKRVAALFQDNDMVVYAGHATLSILTALFPLIMLIISVLNMLPGYSPEDFTNFVFRYLPDLPQVKTFFEGVVTNLREQSTGLLASVAAITALWSASAGVTAVQKGLVKITPDAEKGIKDKVVALLFTLALVVLIPLVLLVNVMGDTVVALLQSFSAKFGFDYVIVYIISVIRGSGAVTAAAAVLLVLLMYTYLPGGRRKLRGQIPGAVLALICWYIFTKLFSIFVPLFWKSSIYGSLASLFLVINWVRIMIMIFFAGGALNSALETELKDTGTRPGQTEQPGQTEAGTGV